MEYQGRNEKLIEINDPSGKWSELTLLPEWEEKYYDVYTVRKHGKWVMLKALKKELAEDPEYQKMLEQEFDVRYRLAHANIVMVNDLDVVPGVGKAIITDDVYGWSLRRLIDEKRLTPKILHRLETQLLDAMDYINENRIVHTPITPDTIIFTEYDDRLKLINVGYDHANALSAQDTEEDIRSYGRVLNEVLDNLPTNLPRLRRIARRAEENPASYRSIAGLQLALERRSNAQIFMYICTFIVLMACLLIWLTLKH
ncbi:MAG: protein kinase [Muribaculaceae bacterium]|nr:protein kinase [Muribaculaceae bacterium]